MKIKLPNFYQRLQQKYQQLAQAATLAQQRGAEELIETLKHYNNIFVQLDAEYEKYFNDYEKMSKLQRLLDKDANEIVMDFNDMVERNLRVDFNVKSSFGPHLPQRLHSFQWNQRCAQIYRLKTAIFEKKPVQMSIEVPLYSRSIATENGTIYLTGGYVKHLGMYLKNCYRYDELFGILNQVSYMNYPHADHSICTIQNFIYVVGTFVGNAVYGYCEVYDTQKDQWKLIADMKVPRTGTSLCTFKNNFIFAFGGRIDQKQIVDTIEVYDISRNAWEELPTPKVDKTKWVPSYMGLAHQITDNEIILFGGKSAVTFHIFNGCFVFDVEKMVIKERGSLVNPCSFMNTPLVFNSNLYAYGNDIYVHQYNIPEQKWSVIPKTSVVLPKS